MKVAKFVEISMAMLKLLSENGVKIDDWQYVDAYKDFLNMRANKVKYRSAIDILSKEKHISSRTLERVFNRLSKIVK